MTRGQYINSILAQFQAEWGVPDVAEMRLSDSLCWLTLAELKAVQDTLDEWGVDYIGSVGHDIHGIARMHNGPKYHRDTFVPRMVRLPEKVKGGVAK